MEASKSVSFADPSPPEQIRWLLRRAGLDIQAAARELGVDEETMRDWCTGAAAPPHVAILALERLGQFEVRDTNS